MVAFFVTIIALVLGDQFIKLQAVNRLSGMNSIPIIKDVLELTYVENRGAAFGMLEGKQIFLVLITTIVVVAIAIYYKKLPADSKYKWLKLSFILIISGAIGNLIDRIRLSYVIDYIYFKLIDFPVFNLADCFVVVGTILLSILILFVYKEDI